MSCLPGDTVSFMICNSDYDHFDAMALAERIAICKVVRDELPDTIFGRDRLSNAQ